MLISPIYNTFYIKQINPLKSVKKNNGNNFFAFNSKFNEKIFKDRNIIKKDEDTNDFFYRISNKIFKNPNDMFCFNALLKEGIISLSSSCYMDLSNPYSSYGVELDKNQDINSCITKLEKYIKNGQGVGINFSKFNNPIDTIIKINNHFKTLEPKLLRPPAGIAILDIKHPKIVDFISLKDNANYDDWCFDLSVILDDEFLSKVDNDEEILLYDGTKIKAKKIYSKLLKSMLKKGEPGVIFSKNPNYICDSCNTSELKPNEGLTLGHINLSKLYNSNTKKIDYNLLKKSVLYLQKALYKIDKNSRIGILGYSDLLKSLNVEYGSPLALNILENCLKIINENKTSLKTAISPTGTISRFLKTSPSIEPIEKGNYKAEIDTLKTAQKYLDGSISKTIILDKNAKEEDIDFIIRNCLLSNLKGICVFKEA